jgi:hypothetical protein
MNFDYMRLPAADAERLCYAEGFENAAKLFARIEALQFALGQATAALVAIEENDMTARQASGAAREALTIVRRST